MSEKMDCPLCGVDYKFFTDLQEHDCSKVSLERKGKYVSKMKYISQLEQCLKDLPYLDSELMWSEWHAKHAKLLNKIRGEK